MKDEKILGKMKKRKEDSQLCCLIQIAIRATLFGNIGCTTEYLSDLFFARVFLNSTKFNVAYKCKFWIGSNSHFLHSLNKKILLTKGWGNFKMNWRNEICSRITNCCTMLMSADSEFRLIKEFYKCWEFSRKSTWSIPRQWCHHKVYDRQ